MPDIDPLGVVVAGVSIVIVSAPIVKAIIKNSKK